MRAFKSFATKMLFGIAATGIILMSTACAEEIPDEYFEEEVDAVDVFEESELISDILPEEETIQEEIFEEEEYLVGDEEPVETNIVASGNCGTPTWVLYDDGTLVISGTGTIMADQVVHQSYWVDYDVRRVHIESGITSIGEDAFLNCSSIIEVVLPEGITSIGPDAFCNCSGIKEIQLPKGITDIGYDAFYNCDGISEIILPEGLISIGAQAFYDCDGISEIIFPESLKSIGDRAFSNCNSIKEIILPEGFSSLGEEAFRYCSGMTSCSFPSTLTEISGYSFLHCENLKSLIIPDGIKRISIEAFSGCSSIETVYLPESLEAISSGAFDYCSSLQEVYYGGSRKDWSWVYISEYNNAALLQKDIHFAKNNTPDSITLNNQEINIEINNRTEIIATFDMQKMDFENSVIENSDPSVVEIFNYYDGEKKQKVLLIRGMNSGSTTITVTTADGSISASCVVNVIRNTPAASLDNVQLSEYQLKLNAGETHQLSYTYSPEDAVITNVTWSSEDNTIASVDEQGVVTANKLGETMIVLNVDGFIETCRIRVLESATSITLSEHEIVRDPFQDYYASPIVVDIEPDYLSLDDLIIETTTDEEESVFTIERYNDKSFSIVPIGFGTGVVTVRTPDGSVSDSCKITFNTSAVLKLNRNTLTLEKGSLDKLQATLVPESDYGYVGWYSSNTDVVEVSYTGTIMAVGVGTATITAHYSLSEENSLSRIATCEVTVKEKEQSQSGSGSGGGDTYIISSGGIALDKYGLNLKVDESATIKATAESGSYVDKWTSSSEDVATVDNNGKVTAKASGMAVITAHGRKVTDYASCIVFVKEKDEQEQGGGSSEPYTTEVILSKDALTLQRGESKTLSATVLPQNVASEKILWLSTDTEIASVNQKGKVTAKAAGTTSIAAIAYNSGVYAVCKVTVKAPSSSATSSSVKSITINKKSLSLCDMQIYHMSGYATMTDGSTKKVKWSSNNRAVVKVNQRGVVTAICEGVAVITAKRGDKFVSCKVTVKPRIKLKSYTLNYSKKSIIVGGKFRLIAKTTNPKNATIKTLIWKSSDKRIATVNKRGVVIGRKKGKVTITATSRDGSINRTCVVTVR